jgi:multidrug efflux pump subunit AcrB
MAENSKVERITSATRGGLSVVYVRLQEGLPDVGKEFDDIKMKLDAIRDLPEGAGPVNFIKDFGDTAALMLTVASPKVGGVEIALRARTIRNAIERTRARLPSRESRLTLVYGFPESIPLAVVERPFALFVQFAELEGAVRDTRVFTGPGFIAMDAASNLHDAAFLELGMRFIRERLQSSEFHPDAWEPIVVRDPAELEDKLAAVAGDKYSYRELDEYTDLIQKTIQTIPLVSKVTRSGLFEEQINLEYSQERLASYGVQLSNLPDLLRARNLTIPGGTLEADGKNLRIDASGEFKNEREILDVLVPTEGTSPVYLRDLMGLGRGYASPPRYLNYYTWRDADEGWHRNRAVTLSVQMRSGGQIDTFGRNVDAALAGLRQRLPEDLVMARTSDQPLQVAESVDLFMQSLYEAIVLVVIVSLIGFWEWRSALLMALSIPITLAMTFGFMAVLRIDLQQISIASLIIALGLLVDDPVVAGDAIKRDMAAGHSSRIAAWLGPTKLAKAILYATITNCVAYLPFLFLPGETGTFLYSLPVVVTASLVASRIVSMTFIPFLGRYLLRPAKETPIEERRVSGFAGRYYSLGSWAIRHRWSVAVASFTILAAGYFFGSRLATQFFPKDLQYLSYVDIWLPEDAPLSATRAAAFQAEEVILETTRRFAEEHNEAGAAPDSHLVSLTTFVGGGGPRFWYSVAPELQQLNYAQIIIQLGDKHETAHMIGPLQQALSSTIAGARIDVRQLEVGPPVGVPVSIRISGDDMTLLRDYADQVKEIFRGSPDTLRVRDDWGSESLAVNLKIDPDRANLAGVTNLDVAAAAIVGMNGYTLTTLREGDKQIPVVAKLRMEERSQLADVQNLYIYSSNGSQKVPLSLISTIEYEARVENIRRRNQFRTVTIGAFPVEGVLPSQVLRQVTPQLQQLQRSLPPGYQLQIGGEQEEQDKGFRNLAIVLAISVTMIFLALVIQFRHAIKPFIVFAAIPYGMVGALFGLWLMDAPFGFMAFLGMISLVGVIVSHIIVLFDFIEEKREEGEPLEQALLDAGIMRLRPVLITVGATVIALVPLAMHGGPLWEPLCYAQIGGLTAATFITLILVPVLYAIFVLDVKLVKWEAPEPHADGAPAVAPGADGPIQAASA